MHVQAVGYGFGRKEFEWANGLRVWLGAASGSDAGDVLDGNGVFEHDQVVVLQCNLDDSTGETLGYVMERLFAAGALDVWFTPIQMKKNRPGVMLSTLSSSDKVVELSSILLRETTTLGVRRVSPVHRLKAGRRVRQVSTPWGAVQVKEKWLAGRCIDVSPEYTDCARLARESGEPFVRVVSVARQAAAAATESSGLSTTGAASQAEVAKQDER
jgi:uncharacterized protein (DUF111 family)